MIYSMWIDDTVELPDLWFQDELSYSGVHNVSKRALNRQNHIYEQAEPDQPINIVGSERRGVLTRSQIESIKALSVAPLAQYTLSYNGTERNFRFRNEDPPSVYADRIETRTFPNDEDHFNNVIIKIVFI